MKEFAQLRDQLARFLALPENWDTFGAKPVTQDVAARVVTLLFELVQENTPEPFLCPTTTGSVQIEWYVGDISLMLEVHPSLEVEFVLDMDGQAYDGELTSHLALVHEAIRRLGS